MKQSFLSLITLCTVFIQTSFAQLQTGENVAVTNTETGKVRGYIHNGIYTYKGIPYAEAKRFESPQKTKSWTNTRSSLSYGPVAPLPDPTTSVSDEPEFVFHHDWGFTNEDCLRINIWSPALNDGKKRPVMFWIHGGGFTTGSSQELPSYDGENLSKKGDVVVVSINHRLNILGFLDLSAYGEKYKNSANAGMIDIVSALEWVKNNISNFGGDPSNVTVFGQSGGGAKVQTLMCMPSAKGLFHKAINESGAARPGMLDKATTQAVAAQLLKELNISTDKVDEIQNVPFQKLSDAGKKAIQVVTDRLKAEGKPVGIPGYGIGWGPSIDGNVLPFDYYEKQSLELSKDIPLLIGTTINEFMPFRGGLASNVTEQQAIEAVKKTYGAKTDAYLSALKKSYPSVKPSNYLSFDFTYRPGAIRFSNEKSALKAAPVYLYLFDWQSPVMDGKYKAVHCMEIPFVFNNIARCEEMTGGTKEAYILSEKMSQAWINFARSGNPNHKGLPNWPAYNASNTATMHFDNTCKVMPQHDGELLEVVLK